MFYTQTTQRGDNILITWVDDNGITQYTKVDDYKPTLYAPSLDGAYTHLITGKKLAPITYDSIKLANEAIDGSHNIQGYSLFGNRNFNLTFVKERFGDLSEKYDPSKIRGFIIDIECPAEHGFPEAHLAEWPINALTIYDTMTGIYNTWGTNPYNPEDHKDLLAEHGVDYTKVVYHCHESESDLLNNMIEFWRTNFPVFVSGWNSTPFDMVYLITRLRNIGISPNLLSPWNKTTSREYEKLGKIKINLNIVGIELLDYLELYKKHRFKTRESYKLGFIGEVEGVGSKLDFEDSATDLRTLYKTNWDTYISYNIIDVAVVKGLEDALGFFEITFAVAYKAGINFEQTLSPVATWENIYYIDQIDKKNILPNKVINDKEHFEGAYVKDPQCGNHRWVVSFDLNSLYPHLMMEFNISPECITGIIVDDIDVDSMVSGSPYDKPSQDIIVNPTGYTFRKDMIGLFPTHMKLLYSERKSIKKEMLVHKQLEQDAIHNSDKETAKKEHDIAKKLDSAQMVRKILLNSSYGACAEKSFCMFDIRLARSITLGGQFAIRWIGRYINESLNKAFTTDKDYVIYTDTDSVYIGLEHVVDTFGMAYQPTDDIVKFVDKFCADKMIPMIERGYTEMQQYINASRQKMIMAREVISDNSIFIAKKMYAMSVWNSEGVAYEKPKIKVMGINSVVKSSTPAPVRDASKKCIEIILNGTENDLHKHIAKFKKEFYNMSIEKIAFPRSVNKVDEYLICPSFNLIGEFDVKNYKNYVKPGMIPMHSRASILHNMACYQFGLDVKPIVGGDKIKFIHVKVPNLINNDVIAFDGMLPKELKLHDKIDYGLMWEKTFHKPIRTITDIVGWSTEVKINLSSVLFGK